MAYVYILESIRDGRYYIGSTLDLSERLKHQRGGFTPSTKRFGEVRLVFTQEYPTLADARKVERKLKNLRRKDYIKKVIRDGYIKIRP